MATTVNIQRLWVNTDHFQSKTVPNYVYGGNDPATFVGAQWVGNTMYGVGTYLGPESILSNQTFTYASGIIQMGEITSPATIPYGTSDYTIMFGGTTLGAQSGIEIIGSRDTTGEKVGTISFHNIQASQTDKLVGELYVYRDGLDNYGSFRFVTTGATGQLDAYDIARDAHTWYVDGLEHMALDINGLVPWGASGINISLGSVLSRWVNVWAENGYFGTSVEQYGTEDFFVQIGSIASGQSGAIEIVGNQSTDTTVGTITFHNHLSGETNKQIAEIRVDRDGHDNAAAFAIGLAGVTGSPDDVYNVTDIQHAWSIDGTLRATLDQQFFSTATDIIPLTDNLHNLGWDSSLDSSGSLFGNAWWKAAYINEYYIYNAETSMTTDSAGNLVFTDPVVGSYTLEQLASGGYWESTSAGTAITPASALSGVTDVLLETGSTLYFNGANTIYITQDSAGDMVFTDEVAGSVTLTSLLDTLWLENSDGSLSPAVSGVTGVSLLTGAEIVMNYGGTNLTYMVDYLDSALDVYSGGSQAFRFAGGGTNITYTDLLPATGSITLGDNLNVFEGVWADQFYLGGSSNVYITADSAGNMIFSDVVNSGTYTLYDLIGAAAGYVNVTGTPSDGQSAVWTDANSIEGRPEISYDFPSAGNVRINTNNLRIDHLSGSSNQMLYVDTNGDLQTQDMPAGTVFSVAAGNGMDFTTITTTGTVTMGAPSNVTPSSTSAASGTTHSHAITGFAPIDGTPTSGSLTYWSSATEIATGNLGGDVATSNTTSTTLQDAAITGKANITSLADTDELLIYDTGVGLRAVEVQYIKSYSISGLPTGSGVTDQIAYWSGTNTLSSGTLGGDVSSSGMNVTAAAALITSKTNITSLADTDEILVYDVSNTDLRAVNMQYVKSYAISGLPTGSGTANQFAYWSDTSILSSGTIGGDATSSGLNITLSATAITGKTDLDSFASGDSILVYDLSNTALREGTITQLQSYMQSNLSFGTGTIDGSGTAPQLAYFSDTDTLTSGNLTGDITSTGTSTTIAAAAITGKTNVASLAAADEFLVNDDGVGLRACTITVLQSYMQSNLSFGTGTIDGSGTAPQLAYFSDTDTLTSGNLTGDVTSTGTSTTIAAGAVESTMVDAAFVTGFTAIGSIAAADSFIIHDSGVGIREATITQLQTYMQNNLTFGGAVDDVWSFDSAGRATMSSAGTDIFLASDERISWVDADPYIVGDGSSIYVMSGGTSAIDVGTTATYVRDPAASGRLAITSGLIGLTHDDSIVFGDLLSTSSYITMRDEATVANTSLLVGAVPGGTDLLFSFRNDGSIYFPQLGSDDTEDHVVAIDDTTGLLTKRAVSSIAGGDVSNGDQSVTFGDGTASDTYIVFDQDSGRDFIFGWDESADYFTLYQGSTFGTTDAYTVFAWHPTNYSFILGIDQYTRDSKLIVYENGSESCFMTNVDTTGNVLTLSGATSSSVDHILSCSSASGNSLLVRGDGSILAPLLGSDDTEDHVVAIDDTTGLLTKRSVSSIAGSGYIDGSGTAPQLAYFTDTDTITSGNLTGHVTSTGTSTTIAAAAVTDQAAISAFASGDSFLVYDASGTALAEGTVSQLQTYMQSNLSFGTGTIDGSGTAPQLAYFSDTDTLTSGNLTGDVTSTGTSTTLSATAITGKTNISAVADADEFLINDSGVGLQACSASTLASYMQSELSFGTIDGSGTSPQLAYFSDSNTLTSGNLTGDIGSTGTSTTAASALITGKTNITALASGDEFLIYDASATGLRAITTQYIQSYMQSNLSFGTGTIDGSGTSPQLAYFTDSNTLTSGNLTGDVTSTGTSTSLGSAVVDAAHLNTNAITGQSDISAFASGDYLLAYNVSSTDLRKGSISALTSYMQSNLSFGTGTVTGTGSSGRVAYWSGTSSLTSSSAFTVSSGVVTASGFKVASLGQGSSGQYCLLHAAPAGDGTFGSDTNLYWVDASNQLYVAGSIYATGNITGYSDIRGKNVLGDIGRVLPSFKELNTFTYELIADPGEVNYGMAAQQLQELFPHAVTYDQEKDQYGIKYSSLAALNTTAIKELEEENALLWNKVAELERKLNKLLEQ